MRTAVRFQHLLLVVAAACLATACATQRPDAPHWERLPPPAWNDD